MTDTEKLRELILKSGMKYSYIAEQIGISRYSLQKKIENNNEFKAGEIKKICKLLKINSLEEKEKIFFVEKVDK